MKNIQASALLISSLILLPAFNATASDKSVGGQLGGTGVGVQYTQKTNWSFIDNDQLQFKVSINGISTDDTESFELNGADYDTDLNLTVISAGVNWYPFSQGFTRNLYFSSGLVYLDSELDGTSESNQNFRVGNTQISAGDDFSLTVDAEQQIIAPYFGFGWGNRLSDRRGFYFQAEANFIVNTEDPDFRLQARDPNNLLQANDLAIETSEFEDDVDDIYSTLTLTVGYQF